MIFENINQAITEISDLAEKSGSADEKAYASLGDLCKSYIILKNSGLPLDGATIDSFIQAFKRIGNSSPKGALGFFVSRLDSASVSANVKELIKLFDKEKAKLNPEEQITTENVKKGDARVGPIVVAVINTLSNNDLDKSAVLKNLANNLSPADSVAAFDKYVEYLKHKVDEQRAQIAKKYSDSVSIQQLINTENDIADDQKDHYKKFGYLNENGKINQSFSATLGEMLLRSLPYQEHNLDFAANLKQDGVIITEQRDAIAEKFITNYKVNNISSEFNQDYDEMSRASNILTQVFNVSQQMKYGNNEQNDVLDLRLNVLEDSTNDDNKYKNIIDQILFFAPMVRDNARIKFGPYENMSKI